MLRVDIEAALVDGSLAVKDLPEAWNAKIKEYLGLDVPNDRMGVLQDVHWSSGQIGTFCNYTIGNVMAAPALRDRREGRRDRGGAGAGRLRAAAGLDDGACAHARPPLFPRRASGRATGRTLDPEPYIAHLTAKYSEIYGLPHAA